MVNSNSKIVPREVLMCVLRYLPCRCVQNLRPVSRMWDEICRQFLRRTFENLLGNVISKKKISEMKCLPACHWYPYTIGCVHYCLLVLQKTIETQFGRSGSVTVPGNVLDRVKEIFSYLNDIPINSELPSDEIYDKLRKFYQVSFSAVGSLEKISEAFYENSRSSYCKVGNAWVTSTIENNFALNACQSRKDMDDLNEKEDNDALNNNFHTNASNLQSDVNQSNSKLIQEGNCEIEIFPKAPPTSNEIKPSRSFRIRRIKRIPSEENDSQSTQVNKIDSQATECDVATCHTNCNCRKRHLRKIEQLEKQVQDCNNLLKESEGRNQEACWKSCTLLSELASCKDQLEKLRSLHKQCVLPQKPSGNQLTTESENNYTSKINALCTKVNSYKSKLAESEIEIAKERKENNILKKRLIKSNRELELWRSSPRNRSLRFYDSSNDQTENLCREKRLCVLKNEIKDYQNKLQRSEDKNKSLKKQLMLLQAKYKKIKEFSPHISTKNKFHFNNVTDTLTPLSECGYDNVNHSTLSEENLESSSENTIGIYTRGEDSQSDNKDVSYCTHCNCKRRLLRNVDLPMPIIGNPVAMSTPNVYPGETPNRNCVFVKSTMYKSSNEKQNIDSKMECDSFSIENEISKFLLEDSDTQKTESEDKEKFDKYSFTPENAFLDEGIKKTLSEFPDSLSSEFSLSHSSDKSNKKYYDCNKRNREDKYNEIEHYFVNDSPIQNEDNNKLRSISPNRELDVSQSAFPLVDQHSENFNINDVEDVKCRNEQISVHNNNTQKSHFSQIANDNPYKQLPAQELNNNSENNFDFDFSKSFEIRNELNPVKVEEMENIEYPSDNVEEKFISENVSYSILRTDSGLSPFGNQNKDIQVTENSNIAKEVLTDNETSNEAIAKLKVNPEIEVMYVDEKSETQLQETPVAQEVATTVAQRVLGVRRWCKQKQIDGSTQPLTRSLRLKRRASQITRAEGSLT